MNFEEYCSELKKKLNKNLEGIAIDIDDTLLATNLDWARQILLKFGNPESLSPEELIRKYKYLSKVPYFGEEVNQWIGNNLNNPEINPNIPTIPGAIKAVNRLFELNRARCYLSTRLARIHSRTEGELRIQGFPNLPIILQPEAEVLGEWGIQNSCEWKIKVLESLYPQVTSLIDDNAELGNYISKGYSGELYLLFNKKIGNSKRVHYCKNWDSALLKIKEGLKNPVPR